MQSKRAGADKVLYQYLRLNYSLCRLCTPTLLYARASICESDLDELRALALPHELNLRDDQLACLVIQRELARQKSRVAGA